MPVYLLPTGSFFEHAIFWATPVVRLFWRLEPEWPVPTPWNRGVARVLEYLPWWWPLVPMLLACLMVARVLTDMVVHVIEMVYDRVVVEVCYVPVVMDHVPVSCHVASAA